MEDANQIIGKYTIVSEYYYIWETIEAYHE